MGESESDIPNRVEHRQSDFQVEEQISHYLDHDVSQIINAFQDGKFVVVTGQTGIGKTEILIPRLVDSLLQKHYNSTSIRANAPYFNPKSTSAYVEGFRSYARQIISESSKGGLVVDDAGFMNLSTDESGIREILTISKQRGFTLIPVIAHTAGDIVEEAAVWQKLGTEVYGKEAVVHKISPDLPTDLTERYLSADNYNNKHFSPEEVQTIMRILPPRLKLLSRMRKIIGEQISPTEFIKSNVLKWRKDEGITTGEEDRKIHDKLAELKEKQR